MAKPWLLPITYIREWGDLIHVAYDPKDLLLKDRSKYIKVWDMTPGKPNRGREFCMFAGRLHDAVKMQHAHARDRIVAAWAAMMLLALVVLIAVH